MKNLILAIITLELENMFVRTKNIVTNIPPLPGTTFGSMKKLIDVMVVSEVFKDKRF